MALTLKQEAFCQAYIEKGNQSEAYRQAYNAHGMKPETVRRAATELFGNPKITARLAELQGEIKATHSVTVASLLAELEEARMVGKQEAKAAAMVSATMGKARIAGLLTEAKPSVDGERRIIIMGGVSE
jgi:phage terminase small subunit